MAVDQTNTQTTQAESVPTQASGPDKSEPYKGLRPYEEENRDNFFGWEVEREILIDKLHANKLTLLFAATGMGNDARFLPRQLGTNGTTTL